MNYPNHITKKKSKTKKKKPEFSLQKLKLKINRIQKIKYNYG